ncbi:hypothetical protein TEPIDINF_001845 [Tepidibacillus infernus]|uniref:DUF2680 domain-containing protein n=1 Tax=Tepidibacillus decaturensis TaxID=1413211 RepID=A0A135L642_9BACI|nr:hypothetical protein [Tepidibacillus decaturensis]KXG44313.1 hypothetical protein U473_10065 [Tepidibacillus decaturensis]
MKLQKVLFASALVGAMGVGAMIGPVVSQADTTPVTAPAQVQQPTNWQPMGMRMGQYFAGSMHEIVAEKIGITADELYAQRTSGKSIEQIAEEKGVTTEQLLEVLVAAKTEQLDQLVKDKVITEDQKNYILERMKVNMEAAITRTEVGPRMGGQWNGQGMRGAGRGFGGGPRWSVNSSTSSN